MSPGIPDSAPSLETVFRRLADLDLAASINIVQTRLQTGAREWQVSCQRPGAVTFNVAVGVDLVSVILKAVGPSRSVSWNDWLRLLDDTPEDVRDLI